ncbi:MAG: DUF2807 domain-containing protein [Rhizobacter sp.]|nr:DUF2807 domain-containing protein [Ferruginibacter sp.]
MKKVIILTALFVSIGSVCISQNKMLLKEAERKIDVSSFEQLTVDGNFKLVLVENDQPAIYIKGNPGFVKSFKFIHNNKNLTIRSNYTKAATNNEVLINVKNLKTLVVQQESMISMVGLLMSENTIIRLNAECIISLSSKDIAKIKADENFELTIFSTSLAQKF